MNKITKHLGKNLRQPSDGLLGWFVRTWMERNNAYLETNAVRLSDIQPHHQVLEVGFGPAVGLQQAYKCVEGGTGMIYGVDFSNYMFNKAQKKCRREIAAEKIELHLTSVMNMPFPSNKFDRVYHCNCYYFWSPMLLACTELYRVMKPHSVMVTTLNWQSVQKNSKENGPLHGRNVDMLQYMMTLEEIGFKDVRVDYLNDCGKRYEAIFAYIHEKAEISDTDVEHFEKWTSKDES